MKVCEENDWKFIQTLDHSTNISIFMQKNELLNILILGTACTSFTQLQCTHKTQYIQMQRYKRCATEYTVYIEIVFDK